MQEITRPNNSKGEVQSERRKSWGLPLLAASAIVLATSSCGPIIYLYTGQRQAENRQFTGKVNSFHEAKSTDGTRPWACSSMEYLKMKNNILLQIDGSEEITLKIADGQKGERKSFEVRDVPGIERIEYVPLRLIPSSGSTIEKDITSQRKAGKDGRAELMDYSIEVEFYFYNANNKTIKTERVVLEGMATQPSATSGDIAMNTIGILTIGIDGRSIKVKPLKFINLGNGIDALVGLVHGPIFAIWNDKFGPVEIYAQLRLYLVRCDK